MRLTLVFLAAFVGTLLLIAAFIAFFKALGKLIDWVKLRTGRSEMEVALAVYLVLFALIVAGGFTAALAAGGKP
jgi:hypothetical protein